MPIKKKKKNVIEQLKDIKAKGGAEAEVKEEDKEGVKELRTKEERKAESERIAEEAKFSEREAELARERPQTQLDIAVERGVPIRAFAESKREAEELARGGGAGVQAQRLEERKAKVRGEQREAGVKFLEERGFFEQEAPKRVELDLPEREGFELIPVLGISYRSLKRDLPAIFGTETVEEMATIIQDPQTLREVMQQQIQADVIKEGLTRSESFGALIESIPAVGSLATKYVGGMLESPKANVETIMKEIASERERASVLAENARTGKLGDPFVAYAEIETIEDNLAKLEMRVKLLANTSGQLLASADEINTIEEAILRAKERAFIAKGAAAEGIQELGSLNSVYTTLRKYRTEGGE